MKIGQIELKVIQCDIEALDVETKVTDCKDLNQETIREAIAKSLCHAQNNDLKSLAFSDLGSRNAKFPLAGVAKIMVQEIMNYKRVYDQPSLKRIVFCLNDNGTFEVFDKTIRGYVGHMLEVLGPGPYVTVDIIIEMEDGIILIERSNPPFGWALPGGFLDYGESLEDAATRETKEETAMDLECMRQFHTYSKPGRDPRSHTVSTVFVAKGKGKPQFGDDAKDLKIMPYESLLDQSYAFDHKEIIKEYLESRNG